MGNWAPVRQEVVEPKFKIGLIPEGQDNHRRTSHLLPESVTLAAQQSGLGSTLSTAQSP